MAKGDGVIVLGDAIRYVLDSAINEVFAADLVPNRYDQADAPKWFVRRISVLEQVDGTDEDKENEKIRSLIKTALDTIQSQAKVAKELLS